MRSAFGFSGQKCSANSPGLRRAAGRRTSSSALLVQKTEAITIGDPTLRQNWLGPVINERAVDRYTEAVGARHGGMGGCSSAASGSRRTASTPASSWRRRWPRTCPSTIACSATSCSCRSRWSRRWTPSMRRFASSNDTRAGPDGGPLLGGPRRAASASWTRSRPASSTSTGAPARPPAPGRASSRSAAGRARPRPASRAAASTTSSSSCASRARRWSTERHVAASPEAIRAGSRARRWSMAAVHEGFALLRGWRGPRPRASGWPWRWRWLPMRRLQPGRSPRRRPKRSRRPPFGRRPGRGPGIGGRAADGRRRREPRARYRPADPGAGARRRLRGRQGRPRQGRRPGHQPRVHHRDGRRARRQALHLPGPPAAVRMRSRRRGRRRRPGQQPRHGLRAGGRSPQTRRAAAAAGIGDAGGGSRSHQAARAGHRGAQRPAHRLPGVRLGRFTESDRVQHARVGGDADRAGPGHRPTQGIAADVRRGAAPRRPGRRLDLHAGYEGFERRPTSYQRHLARAALGAGATLVIGAHPHVLQGSCGATATS